MNASVLPVESPARASLRSSQRPRFAHCAVSRFQPLMLDLIVVTVELNAVLLKKAGSLAMPVHTRSLPVRLGDRAFGGRRRGQFPLTYSSSPPQHSKVWVPMGVASLNAQTMDSSGRPSLF